METVYLETIIVSYLAAQASRDLIVSAHQQITREWWDIAQKQFKLFVSEAVLEEIRVVSRNSKQLLIGTRYGVSSSR